MRPSANAQPAPPTFCTWLPRALNGLAARRPRLLLEQLFGAATATLTEFAANAPWARAAFTLVLLHTWKQNLARLCTCMPWARRPRAHQRGPEGAPCQGDRNFRGPSSPLHSV